MANYPEILDSFTPKVDNVDDVMATDINELQTAIQSLETKVGIDNSEDTDSIDYILSKKQDALNFTPEDSLNKKTDLTDNSDTYYPTQKAVKTAIDLKQDAMTKASSSDINTGSDDAKYLTSKGLNDSKYPQLNGADVMEVVEELPVTPDADTLYFIKE